jgi:tetratricopeptide (TPR) repeat protein
MTNYNKAINYKPDHAEAYNNLGFLLDELKHFEDAIVNYKKATSLKPEFAEAYNNLGGALTELKRYDEALLNFGISFKIDPEIDYLLDNLIHTKMQICDWNDINILADQLIENTIKLEKICNPFIALPLIDNPALHKQAAKIYASAKFPENKVLGRLSKYPKHQKIRIGYFSADFRMHPVSYLTAELFELHNRNDFEIVAFSFGPNTQDALRKRLENSFDQFIDVKDKTDEEIAHLARKMEIDIAVDLGGFTADCRTGIFAMRAAPIQLSYIGYLGTMGADYYDYLIADTTIIPQNRQQYYSEKIVYLPSYQVNDNKREVSEKVFTKSELGLPEDSFVFCCFNSTYKITPSTFRSWMRILSATENSVLLLLDDSKTATINLKKEASDIGLSPDRLIFAKPIPLPDYLARYRIADLFLDTLPYNAGTTASDALRMGLPVLTQMGESFASRMAGSLLHAVGLPELITTNQETYESLAIKFATNPQKLEAIKTKLINNLPNSPLYNTKLFTEHLESAYATMYQRHQNDLSSEHIKI